MKFAPFPSKPVVLSLAFALLISQVVAAATLTVGSGLNCDYATISSAIDDAQSNDVIRVESGSFTMPYKILAKNLTLRGRLGANCSTATPGSTATVVRPSQALQRFFGVVNSSLTLEDITFTEGVSTQDGGVIWASGSFAVITLTRAVLLDNRAIDSEGGAVHLTNGAFLFAFDSTLSNNRADRGGAISCDGGEGIWLYGSSIADNNAVLSGGGVFLRDCDLNSVDSLSGPEPVTRFLRNGANQGGGIGAVGASEIRFRPLQGWHHFENNDATSGGAIYVNGADAVAEVSGVRFVGNTALSGGAVAGISGPTVSFGAHEPTCARLRPCVVADSNVAADGAVVFASNLTMRESALLRNRNTDSSSALIDMTAGPGSATIESSLIAETPASHLGELICSNSDVLLRSSTIAFNLGSDALLGGSGGTIQVDQSIFWGNSAPVYDGAFSTTSFECNLVSSLTGMPAGHSLTVVGDPLFAGGSPGSYDYRLLQGSPAQDMCGNAAKAATRDLDHQPRPRHGNYDAGAYESAAFLADFELGSTSRFSSVTP